MSTSVIPGQLVAALDETQVAQEAATRIAKAIREAVAQRGIATLALSGGNTPRPAYERLSREPNVPWNKVSVFWIDERAVPPTSPRSNYKLAKESLLDAAPVPPENVYRMIGEAVDLDQAAREYEVLLRKLLVGTTVFPREFPSFDVAVMGIGDDGHTASLFPGEASVDVRDRLVLSVPEAAEKGREARLSVTAPVIENVETVLVLAVGAKKKEPLQRIWSVAGSTKDTPARVLRDVRGTVYWIVEKAAGGFDG